MNSIATTPEPPEPPEAPRASLKVVAWTGGGLVIGCALYLVLLQSSTLWSRPVGLGGVFSQFRGLFGPEWLAAPRTSEVGLLNSGLYLFLLGGMFAAYWLALRYLWRAAAVRANESRTALRLMLGSTTAALFVLFWVPGVLSADLHSYIWYGRIWGIYGDNPFLHVPSEYAGRAPGEWLDLVYWPDVPSVYGPLWVWTAGAIAGAAHSLGDVLAHHILGHRALAGVAHLVNIVLVWHISRYIAERFPSLSASTAPSGGATVTEADRLSGRRVICTLTYAWNPLLLIEFGANGHNDVLMLTGIFGGILLHLTGRWHLATVALALTCMIKVAALPFLMLYFLRLPFLGLRRPGARFKLAGLAFGVWVVCYLPFWQGPEVLEPLWGGPAATLFTNSLAAMLRYNGAELVQPLVGQDVEAIRLSLEAPLRAVSLIVTVSVAAVWIRRARSLPQLLDAWGWILFIYLTVGAVWFWPWYVSWLILPVALLGSGRLFKATQILCFTSMSLYAIYPELPEYLSGLIYTRSLIVIAPAMVYVGASVWQERRARSPYRGAVQG